MLVAYDEIDFDVGVTRFKEGGGHGGHNGIRDIISALGGQTGSSAANRCRAPRPQVHGGELCAEPSFEV